jgi:DNA-binding response OmpR family regulator
METNRLRRLHPVAGIAVVAEPDHDARALISSTLASANFQLTTASTFLGARDEIAQRRPVLLVAEYRLGVFNGLHLARRARTERRDAVLILTSRQNDVVLEHESVALGATPLLAPVKPDDLLLAVIRTATQRPNADGTWTPVRAPFDRRSTDRRDRSQSPSRLLVDRRTRDRRVPLAWDLLLPAIFQRFRDR